MTSDASADLMLMRASMLLDTDPAAAARHASDIIVKSPDHEQANLLLAAACRRLGDSATATSVLESICKVHPASAAMQFELGRTYAAAGRGEAARAAFLRAVELDPHFADAWRDLAAQHFLAGDAMAGDAAYLTYSRLAPNPPELTDAHVALTENRLDAAEAVLRRHLAQASGDVVALRMLAQIATRRGDDQTAEKLLTGCLELAPGDAASRYDLAQLLCQQQRLVEALALLERLLATEPRNPGYLSLKAQSIRLMGREAEALALMEGVVADHPNDPQYWVVLGTLLRETGEQARAIEAYRRSLVAQPGFGFAYWTLASLKTFRFTDEDIVAMQAQLARNPAFASSRKYLEFALGKACEDAERFEASFQHYARGNALQRAAVEYDPAATTAYVQRAKTLYTARFFADRADWGIERSDPIFIVGLPRSGSTLLEQILASHTQVEGAHELAHFPAMMSELYAQSRPDEPAHRSPVESLDQAAVELLATRYLARTEALRPLKLPRFVDKMLENFSHVGLLHLMFPRASIIDARRRPMACCLSCYKELFARGMAFSYDLGELGRHYRDYVDLMAHFDDVLPGRVYRVQYEELIADPEREVRRLLEYCRLPFEAGCLRFYDNPRAVYTVSSEQVRQPIYSDAIDRWRRFESWLGALKDALGSLADQ